jgi:hypothetical protein
MGHGLFYPVRFVVEGSGPFPIEMLQHDRACPANPDAVGSLRELHRRRVSLLRFTAAGKSGPDIARWRSLGWTVLEVIFHDNSYEPLG